MPLTSETVVMRVAIVSDIHGNRQAFEAVLDAVADTECEELWCLGDLVGYGADPDVCVALARENAAICLAGNHDLGVRGSDPAGAVLTRGGTGRHLDQEGDQRGDPRIPRRAGAASTSRNRWRCTTPAPATPYGSTSCPRCRPNCAWTSRRGGISLIGHSHVALSFSRVPGDPATGQTRGEDEEVGLQEGEWLVNPGSVGQPRDGDPRRPGWSSTLTSGERSTGAPNTT